MNKQDSSFEKSKDYKFQAKLYPDCKEYVCNDVLDRLVEMFDEWAYILHDRDERTYSCNLVKPLETKWKNWAFQIWTRSNVCRGKGRHTKKPHIHFYGRNNHNRQFSLNSFIRALGVPYKYSENGDFQYISSWAACMVYSVHKNAPDKYQYPVSDVKTNIINFYTRYIKGSSPLDELELVMQYIEDSFVRGSGITYFQLIRLCNQKGLSIHLSKPSVVKDCLYSFRNPDRL